MKAANENSNNASFEIDADDIIDFGSVAAAALQDGDAEKVGQDRDQNGNCIFASKKS